MSNIFTLLHTDDHFRARFLHGRRPMLAALAARLRTAHPTGGAVWVDLGGGTGANVEAMAEFLPLSFFKAVIVVDLCAPLVRVARDRVAAAGWPNVHVVHGDACAWRPPSDISTVDAVTFSYSLSMIPCFHTAVDAALEYLTPTTGLIGCADFYVSGRHDHPHRQHGWPRRTFWRSVFETDGIFIGPERRAYLDHKLERVWEVNGMKERESELPPLREEGAEGSGLSASPPNRPP